MIHGTRTSYVTGCRCPDCTAANTRYYHERKEWVNGYRPQPLIDAAPTRRHLGYLRRGGMGLRTVSRATGLSLTGLREVRSGRTKRVRRETELTVLSLEPHVELLPAGARIDAAPTWRRIDALLRSGWTRGRIAVALGASTPSLQIGQSKVTVRVAAAVNDLYGRVVGGLRCSHCGELLSLHTVMSRCGRAA